MVAALSSPSAPLLFYFLCRCNRRSHASSISVISSLPHLATILEKGQGSSFFRAWHYKKSRQGNADTTTVLWCLERLERCLKLGCCCCFKKSWLKKPKTIFKEVVMYLQTLKENDFHLGPARYICINQGSAHTSSQITHQPTCHINTTHKFTVTLQIDTCHHPQS